MIKLIRVIYLVLVIFNMKWMLKKKFKNILLSKILNMMVFIVWFEN